MTTLESLNYSGMIDTFDIGEQTKTNYKASLRRVQKLIGDMKLTSASKVIELINKEMDNTNVKSATYSALLRVLEAHKKQNTKYYKLYKEQKDINQKSYNKEPKKLPKVLEEVNLKDLQKTYKTYIKEKGTTNREERILGFYILHPPRRLDYSNTDVVDIEDEVEVGKNYLFINNDKYYFIFTEYKTKKTYGIQKIQVKDKTLIQMLKDRDLESGMSFYTGSKKTIQRDIRDATTRIFGKALNIQQLRILWSSSKFKKIKEELIIDSEAMGHSVSTKLSNYIR